MIGLATTGFTPPFVELPATITPGMRWPWRGTSKGVPMEIESALEGVETVVVPAGSFSCLHIRRSGGPLSVTHLGQLPSVTISFDLRPGVALSQAIDQVTREMATMQVPATINGSFQGTAQAFQASLQGMGLLLLFAVFVYLLNDKIQHGPDAADLTPSGKLALPLKP